VGSLSAVDGSLDVAATLSPSREASTWSAGAPGGTGHVRIIPQATGAHVDGTHEVEAHGTREMPVWGRAVRYAPGIVCGRIRAIVNYISTLQVK
jgi:hypothetical protein